MINWEKNIDNEKIFQRLVNHLFALECNSPGFIPSSPYIGADRAWDGCYEGHYSLEGTEGIWSIQSKWTTKSLKKAYSSLSVEIKKELENAKRNKVQHLRIATNAELNVEHVRDLESLNKGEVATLRVWHREGLSLRIELQPYLRYLFFKAPQHPTLIPWDAYFSTAEPNLLEEETADKITKIKEYLEGINKFISADDLNILLIHSPGGFGKSHLLREAAKLAHQTAPDRQPWLIRPGLRKMEDVIQDEIIEPRKYLLILDDADRTIAETKPLLSLTKHKQDSIKIILALRTSGLRVVREKIGDLRVEERIAELNISEWEKEDLIELLRVAAGQSLLHEDEEMIAAMYPNPFLIVWIGRQIKKEKALDFQKIREKFVNEIDYDAKQCLRSISGAVEVRDFLVHLASISPFSLKEENVLESLSLKLKKEIGIIREEVINLKEAGLLKEVGNYLRFNPDMKGDLYLAYKLEETKDGRQIEDIIETWFPLCPERLFINIEAATRYAEIPALEENLRAIIDAWIKDAQNTPSFTRGRRLKLLESVTSIVPHHCLSLLTAYVRSEDTAPEEPEFKGLGIGYRALGTDDYGPIIIRVMRNERLRESIIDIIEELNAKGKKGVYDTYKPPTLIKHSVSPLHNTPQEILKTLGIFQKWLENPTDSKIKLISEALSEILAGSHEYTKSTITGMIIGEKILETTKEAIDLRNKALSILIAMIGHDSVNVRIAGVRVAEEIGHTRMGRIGEEDLPLSGQIEKEREEIIEEIAKKISPEADYHLLNEIENLFMKWWAQNLPGSNKAAGYLVTFPRSIEYKAFRYFASPDYAIKDFEPIKKCAPKNDRWGWYVENYMHNENCSTPAYYVEIVKELNAKYDSEEKIKLFLRDLSEKIAHYDRWPRPPIVECWVNTNPKVFLSIRRKEESWKQIPERFQNEIDSALSMSEKGIVEELAEEILADLSKAPYLRFDTFLSLLAKEGMDERKVETWLVKILENGTSEQKALTIFYLNRIYKKPDDINIILKLLFIAVSGEKELSGEMARSLSLIIHNFKKYAPGDKGLKAKLQEEVLKKIKDVKKIGWHEDEVIHFSATGIEQIAELIEYRLSKAKEIGRRTEFDAIPFDGIKSIQSNITSFADYKKIMEIVIRWEEEGDPIRGIDLEHLMKPVRSLIDKETGRLFIGEYVEEQLEEGELEKVMHASEHLELNEGTAPILVKVCETAISKGFSQEVKEILYGKLYPKSYSSKPGAPPPALVAIRSLFQKMHEMASNGELKIIVEKCIEAEDKSIEDHLKRDEKVLTPRG